MAKIFERHSSEFLRARDSGDFRAALESARAAHLECPDMHVKTWFWWACMSSLLGDAAEAVSALRAGLVEGLWWSPHQLDRDPDLDPIRGSPGFDEVRAECAGRYEQEQARARPQCLVLAPSSATWEPRSLVLIHGRGDNASLCAARWGELVDEGWTLIIPQSSQMYDSSGFCWDDMDLARQELRNHLDDSRRKRGIETDGMVIAGASQGGRLALELAHERGVPWLCVAPSFPAGYDVAPLIGVPMHTRGAFLLAERDPASAGARRVISALESGGLHVLTRTMKDVGYGFPEDFPRQAADTLRALSAE